MKVRPLIIKTFGLLGIFFAILLGIIIFSHSQNNPSSQKIIETQPSVKSVSQVEGAVSSISVDIKTPPKKVSTRFVYFGLWTQGFWDPNTNTLHPEALTSVENKIGKHAAIAHFYRGWEALVSPELLSDLNTINANGWRPMVSANPYFFDKCPANGTPLYKAIASGNCDEFLKSIGKNLKQFGKPIFLRFAWEMNIPSMEWQIERTGSTGQDFIAAWQRMHDIIYSENATNVLWVFSPDVSNTSYENIYPGDAFVDWIGLDGYNWGTTQPWSKWQSFSDVFSAAYRDILKLAPDKPLMLAEVNTTDKGGDKSAWYQDMLATQIPLNFPRIKAVVFYNEDRTAKENVNWLIDISQASLNSFSQSIQSPVYLPSF